jgi:hypothetical protein
MVIQFMSQYRRVRVACQQKGSAAFSGAEVHDFHASNWHRPDFADRFHGSRNMPGAAQREAENTTLRGAALRAARRPRLGA